MPEPAADRAADDPAGPRRRADDAGGRGADGQDRRPQGGHPGHPGGAGRHRRRPAIPAATAAISTIQRIAGSLGTALLAVTLQHAISARLPGFGGSVTGASALAAADPARALPALADAFGATFWVALGLTAASLVAAFALPGRPAARPSADAPQARQAPEPAEAGR